METPPDVHSDDEFQDCEDGGDDWASLGDQPAPEVNQHGGTLSVTEEEERACVMMLACEFPDQSRGTLKRFAAARSFDLSSATILLQHHLQWREDVVAKLDEDQSSLSITCMH